jgi:hypothetical protein
MDNKQKSKKLMDYELMMDVFNRVPAEARPGGKYGLIAGFGYAGDYPTKGDVTTPRQFGQQTPEMIKRGQAPAYLSGNKRVSGFYTPPGYDVSTNRAMQSKRLFPMGTPVADEVYYQDLMDPSVLGLKNTPDRTIMHEFYHRGATKLPLKELAEFAEKKGDKDSALIFKQMQKTAGEHFLVEAIDAYVDVGGDESKLSRVMRNKLERIEKANNVIREFMTPEKQKELGLRMPLKESKPKKKGLFDRFLK